MMDIQNRILLKSAAADALAATSEAKKMILLHTGAALILSMLLTVSDYFLEQAIAGTGGLGGLGTRTILATLQGILPLLQTIILPFWQIGYVYVTLKFARRETCESADLCKGFHLFLPVLRLLLLQGLLYLSIGFIASQLGTFLFMLTPWSAPLMEAAMKLMSGSGTVDSMNAAMEQMLSQAAVPLMICGGIVFILLCAPFFYRFRMARFVLLENPEAGALNALRTSGKMMRGNAVTLLKLDISFWWFYLLDLGVTVVCYADALLKWLGISLPVSTTAAFFISFVLYLLLQLALYYWRQNEVSTTYAVFYDTLKSPKENLPQTQNLP